MEHISDQGTMPNDRGKDGTKIRLESPAFKDGERIPKKYTGYGEEASPPLAWRNVPEGTKELALICEDLDLPFGWTWTHWVIYRIPPGVSDLQESLPPSEELENGALQGRRGFGGRNYLGPRPPGKKPHRYRFRLFALREPLELAKGANKKLLMSRMSGKVIDMAELTGTFSR